MKPYKRLFSEMAVKQTVFKELLESEINQIFEHLFKLKLTQKSFADRLHADLHNFVFDEAYGWEQTIYKWVGLLYRDLRDIKLKSSTKEKVYREILDDADVLIALDSRFLPWTISGFSNLPSNKLKKAKDNLRDYHNTTEIRNLPWVLDMHEILYSLTPRRNIMQISLEEVNESIAKFLESLSFKEN